jgi:hypothetical protein
MSRKFLFACVRMQNQGYLCIASGPPSAKRRIQRREYCKCWGRRAEHELLGALPGIFANLSAELLATFVSELLPKCGTFRSPRRPRRRLDSRASPAAPTPAARRRGGSTTTKPPSAQSVFKPEAGSQ